MSNAPPNQPSRRPSSSPVRARSVARNILSDISVVRTHFRVREPVTKSIAATLATTTSLKDIQKPLAVFMGSTTESSPINRVCAARPATDKFSSKGPAAAIPRVASSVSMVILCPIASLASIEALADLRSVQTPSSSDIEPVFSQSSRRPVVTLSSSRTTGIRLRSIFVLATTSAPVASERPTPVKVTPFPTTKPATSADHVV